MDSKQQPAQPSDVSEQEPDPISLVEVQSCPKCSLSLDLDVSFCPKDGTPLKQAMSPGSIFAGRYELLGEIGSGGMSVIYKARHQVMNKLVAIKMLHPHLIKNKAMMRFQQEAKAASSLRHPNIISIHDFGTTEQDQPFMVMDFVEGTNCADLIAEQGPLPLPRALEIFSQLCSALEHAHKHGVLHRDLKPSNVMIVNSEKDLHVLLVDFGIAKILDSDSSVHQLTQTGELFGSPLYMSPEQCLGQNLDVRSDIYSLGCVFYELLTGKPPLAGQSVMETVLMHINDTPKTLTEALPERTFPESFERFVAKLLATDPKNRFQSVSEVLQTLAQLQNGVGIIGAYVNPQRQNKENKMLAWTISATIIGMLLLMVFGPNISPNSEQKITAADTISETTKLDLRNTPITDQDLRLLLAHHKKLEQLDVRNTNIADGSMAAIQALPLLTYLVLDNTGISNEGIKDLDKLKNLNFLSIDGTKVTDEGLRHLSHNTKIQTLSLAGKEVTDVGLAYLSSLASLEELHLRNTNVTDKGIAEVLPKFKRLKRLSLEQTQVSDKALSTIANMPTLVWLQLAQTAITDAGVKELVRLPFLAELYLSRDKIADEGLRSISLLQSLRKLHLDSTRVTDKGLLDLVTAKSKLVLIDLTGCEVTPDAVVGLRRALPGCTVEHRE